MSQSTDTRETVSTEGAEGLEIGAVCVKWARRGPDGTTQFRILRHEGRPEEKVRQILSRPGGAGHRRRIVVTGQAARLLLDLPYRPETECLEKAVAFHGLRPDILLSLGGEIFTVYPMQDGRIRNVLSTSKCAAGTGEFIVQQLQRMGLSIEAGLSRARSGSIVELATRCSVHCKSDATHKLNKGECSPRDIARSLIWDLARKVAEQIRLARWPTDTILLCGGVSMNRLFVEDLCGHFPGSRVQVLPESPYLEAFGASLFAAEDPAVQPTRTGAPLIRARKVSFPALPPLREAEPLLDYRAGRRRPAAIRNHASCILGVDAGSTTTKAVLFDVEDGSILASAYLRTLGNPVLAVKRCLQGIAEQVRETSLRIVQAGVTGSGRELVSVFLDNCESYNEILAHARAAAEEVPDVDTVFEIGGQDSKYISFLEGVPVDYAMNEGCSAGTGSFIEESASVDMAVPTEQISSIAESSDRPIAFGERCAAFINTDLRNALQQGARPEDVIAGLLYSVADNYISRVVGPRHIGSRLLFLGGVALNRAAALALAARTRQRLVVPPHPELMGCVGTALMVRNRLRDGDLRERAYDLHALLQGEMEDRGAFRCTSCEKTCEIKRIAVRGRVHPFGGLCSRYEILRRRGKTGQEGWDGVTARNRLVFEGFGQTSIPEPRGRIGLPMALTSFELFPFYAKLIEALGFVPVLSRPSGVQDLKGILSICYPGQLAYGAVRDLADQGVDFILLPHVIEIQPPAGGRHGYTCPSTTLIPDILRAAIPDLRARILSPHIGLSEHLLQATLTEIGRLGPILGIDEGEAKRAGERALAHYRQFLEERESRARQALERIDGDPTVILAGRPYTVCAPEANLSLPRKITSRGYHVLPVDMLPSRAGTAPPRDVWYFTQQIHNAIAHARASENLFLCLVSCFSCGPDSSVLHSFRQQLAGRTFCYLEIDSHTAHTGFETRLGAFLDIIEDGERRRKRSRVPTGDRPAQGRGTRTGPSFRPARLSDRLDAIIDSDGNRVAYDDPRVVHVWTADHSPLGLEMIARIYQRKNRRFRVASGTSPATMRLARRLCSGRECVPMTAMVGATLQDISRHRSEKEITIYFSLDQEGPCQNGAWPLVWETFCQRLGLRNVICGVWPGVENNCLGMGGEYNLLISGCLFLGDLFEEAQNTLRCLARDREHALETFRRAFERFAARFAQEGEGALEPGLTEWARTMASVPLDRPVEETPKVLIVGGLNLLFVHRPVTRYLLDQGILPKLVPYSESLCWLAAEPVVRHGFEQGLITPREQFACRPSRRNRLEAARIRQARFSVTLIGSAEKRFRQIMEGSGLLFDVPIPFLQIAEQGHRHASHVGFTETTLTTGRYLCSVEGGLYDGIVNLGSFNCQPAMNAQAIIRPLANRCNVPYVALDCEGPWLSASQLRLLEALSVQARRTRHEKNRARLGSLASVEPR